MSSITKRDVLTAAMLGAPLMGLAGAAQAAPADAGRGGGPFATRHTGTFNGQTVDYVATVGEIVISDAGGTPTLSLVSTSYVRQGVEAAKRPVLFLFNGGPSVSSATLQTLSIGPKRIVVSQDPRQPMPAPPTMVDNRQCVLDTVDLVFIDPAETGFSRVLPGGKRADFYTTEGDARAVSDFILAWLKANGREDSPRYVLGESYGTIRAAVVAGQLAKTRPLDGVFLFGQAVNMIETSQRAKNALSYALNLTALAAVAAYHGRATYKARSMAALIDETYAWAMEPYLSALLQGYDLPPAQARKIADKLQALTGVGADYYLSHDLIISKPAFSRELLRDQGLILGIYDARYAGPAPAAGQRAVDPFAKVQAPILAMATAHLSGPLAVTWPMSDYRGAAPGAETWVYDPTEGPGGGGPFLDYDYQARLSEAFDANPRFHLMIGTGVYDLTTTVGPARYLVTKSRFPRDRVYQRQYEGGHVAYTNDPTLLAFAADVRAFVSGKNPAA